MLFPVSGITFKFAIQCFFRSVVLRNESNTSGAFSRDSKIADLSMNGLLYSILFSEM